MAEHQEKGNNHPIDVVILWIDGSDPKIARKKEQFLDIKQDRVKNDTHPTRFSSLNEIRYCVLSIFKFAPFVRNVFIVTDEQDPNLYDEIKINFPEKLDSIKIVDHEEIFKGYEEYLPTFNSTAIESLMWRINGLSENFVYFNDDFMLIREIKPEYWFINDQPVLRGKWRLPPFMKMLKKKLKEVINKRLFKNPNYKPKFSFYISQWYAARLLGMKYRYFFVCHIPYVFRRSILENFLKSHKEVLYKNIKSRFRTQNKYNLSTLANHLEILNGNKQLAELRRGYFHPSYSKRRLYKKIEHCKNDTRIKTICVQNLDLFDKQERDYLFNWMDQILT